MSIFIAFATALVAVLPQSAPAQVPDVSDVVREGILHITHSDNFRQQEASYAYTLTDNGQTIRLRFEREPRRLLGGERVRVTGTQSGKTLVLQDGGAVQSTGASGSVAASATGARKVAVILFNFAGDTRQPFTPEQARAAIFTNSDSVNAYYQEQSFGKVSFTGRVRSDGDVFGWYTISNSNSSCPFSDWSSAARTAAVNAGVDLTGYDHYVYIYPSQAGCGFAGAGEVPGSNVWINGSLTTRVIGHELGHNLGVHHASSLSCTDAGGARVAISGSCSRNEYGDPFDIMGSSTRHTNNWHKAQYGWFGAATMVTASSGGTFTIAPQERPGGTELVRVPRGSTGNYYYLEFRQPFGFDNFSPSDPVVNGVTIRMAPDYGAIVQSSLIDTTPGTSSFSDAPLTAGQTFTDPDYGISITSQSVAASGATVQIAVGGSPPPPPPGDTQAPTVPTGLTSQAQPGPKVVLSWNASSDDVGVTGYRVYRLGNLIATTSTPSYTDTSVSPSTYYNYTVAAFDAAGNISSPSVWTYLTTPASNTDTQAPTVPTGLTSQAQPGPKVVLSWSGSTDNVGVVGYRVYRLGNLIATTTSPSYTDLSVSPSTYYNYTVAAYDAAGNISSPSVWTYLTTPGSSPADATPPTAPTSLTGQALTGPKVSLSWSPSSDNVGVAGYRVYRNGVQVGSSDTTAYTDSGVAAYTTYTYTVRAYDAAGNTSTSSNSFSVRTGPGGGGGSTDTTPPTAPSNLTAQKATYSANLSWTGSIDNVGVVGYKIFRNGFYAGMSSTTSWLDYSFGRYRAYGPVQYYVRAYDAAGNLSPPTDVITVS